MNGLSGASVLGVEGAKHERFPGEETLSDSSFALFACGENPCPLSRRPYAKA